jgi:hypothetical protein
MNIDRGPKILMIPMDKLQCVSDSRAFQDAEYWIPSVLQGD